MITATDFFCGMGGSSSGLVEAGMQVKLAANHWDRAIETHSANHPDTEHICADLQAVDLRYLPKTDVLWASPICTEVSPAGGRRKKGHQQDLFEDHGHVPSAAFERTRVTFWEVIRACEIHRYPIVFIENVIEAADWDLFDVWLAGMTTLGYEHQFISVSAAHIGSPTNPYAPQWRDRMYLAFHRRGVPMPTIEPRPLAYCPVCDDLVEAIQWWKPKRKHASRRIGKYGAQYLYVCPIGNHGVIEPVVAPAATAIDWTDLGVRIGDRKRTLAPSTMLRINHAADMLARGAFGPRMVFNVNHSGGDGRPFDPDLRPLPTATAKRGEGLLVAAAGNTWDGASGANNAYVRAWPTDGSPTPTQATTAQFGLVTMLRNHGTAATTDDPLATFTGGGHHHGLVIRSHGGHLKSEADSAVKSTDDPLPPVRAAASDFLVVPYRKGAKPQRTELATPPTYVDVEDLRFRMLKPREAASAQRFPRTYAMCGNLGEQQMQSGNAVAVNVAHWIGSFGVQALGGAA